MPLVCVAESMFAEEMASGSGGSQAATISSEGVSKKPPPTDAAAVAASANGRAVNRQQNGTMNSWHGTAKGKPAVTGDSLAGGLDVESDSEEEAGDEDEDDEDDEDMDDEDVDDEDGEEDVDDEDVDDEDEDDDTMGSDEDEGEAVGDDNEDDDDDDVSSMSGAELLPARGAAAVEAEPSKKSVNGKISSDGRKRERKPVLGKRMTKEILDESYEAGQNSLSDDESGLSEEDGEEQDEGEDDDVEEEEESEEGNSPGRLKIDEEEAGDENRRRSGRERRVPKKFEIEVPNSENKSKNKKKPPPGSGGVAGDSEDDYYLKGRKRKKLSSTVVKETDANSKKRKKSSSPAKAMKLPSAKSEPQYKKLTRKIKKRPAVLEDSGDETDVSEGEMVSKSFKRSVSKQHGGSTVAANKSNRARERVKYEEDRESHSSDVRSDIDEADLAPRHTEEDVDTIDFVLDHRMGK